MRKNINTKYIKYLFSTNIKVLGSFLIEDLLRVDTFLSHFSH